MYRTEILGINVPPAPADRSRLPGNSDRMDSVESIDEWKGTLNDLKGLQPSSVAQKDEKEELPMFKTNEEPQTLENIGIKQKNEEALSNDRDVFDAIANHNNPEQPLQEDNQDVQIMHEEDVMKESTNPIKLRATEDLDIAQNKPSGEEFDPFGGQFLDEKDVDSLQMEKVSLASLKNEKILKKLEIKQSSVSTTDSLDTEAEQQKLADIGSSKLLMKLTLDKMHNEIGRLTLDQRELCRACYKHIEKHPVPFGISVMIRLFSTHPQYKNVWRDFREIPDSSLMNAPELRRHAKIYMGGLKLIINSMNDDKKLETVLRGIAQAHVKWHVYKHHLINMLPCVIEAFKTKFEMNLDQVNAWTTLFDVIANLIDIFRSA